MGCAKSKSKIQLARSTSDSKNVPRNDRMIQNVLLVWLDVKIDEEKSDCQNTIRQLRRVFNTINTFTDAEQCIQFLENTPDENICMLISGSLAEQIVPRVHYLAQMDSIFIFCNNRKYHETWTKDWSKIRGVFTKIRLICDALKQTAQQCEQNAIAISILGDGSDGASEKTGNRLDPSFMYTQIIKEILLTINFEQQHIDEFIRQCRELLADNGRQLQNVDQLAREYHQHTPIWWYTFDCFLYPMLNRALRTMDADLMIKMGFFIADLHRHIEQLHQQQFGSDNDNQSFTVYRGQSMDKDAFEKMVINEGGLMSFNFFLSTSKNRSTSLNFAQRALKNAQLVGVLFVMNIDANQSSTPFASATEVGYYGAGEDEVLFSMHTVFRIGKTTPLNASARLMQVQLNLASDKDNDLRELIDYIREETFPHDNGWYRLSLVLYKMGESAKAQQMCERLLEQETAQSGKAPIYHQLGLMKCAQGKYAEAVIYYEKSIGIQEKQIPPDDRDLAMSYNNIGSAYFSMGDCVKALSSHEKALAIRQQSLPPTHPELAMSYHSIGNVYDYMGDYSEALLFYEEALTIEQQSLPHTHPTLAISYGTIGDVYRNIGDYPKALSFFEEALTIQQKSLPPAHPDLAAFYNNIGLLYFNMSDYAKALSSHEKALAIQQKSLAPTHSDLAKTYNNIGLVYYSIGDHPKALSSHENALLIRQQSLSPTHSDSALSYHNIGLVYYSMGDYLKALSLYEEALTIQQQSLASTHPDLVYSYNNIGNVYYNIGDYPKALLSHENALLIRQQSLPPTHPDLARSYNNIGCVYCSMCDYPKAFASYEKALTIRKKALSDSQPDLSVTYYYMGLLLEEVRNYWKAYSYYKHAVELAQHSEPTNHLNLSMWMYNLVRIKQML